MLESSICSLFMCHDHLMTEQQEQASTNFSTERLLVVVFGEDAAAVYCQKTSSAWRLSRLHSLLLICTSFQACSPHQNMYRPHICAQPNKTPGHNTHTTHLRHPGSLQAQTRPVLFAQVQSYAQPNPILGPCPARCSGYRCRPLRRTSKLVS